VSDATPQRSEWVGRPDSRPLAEPCIDESLIWALVEAAPDALVVIDEQGTIELVNTRLEELFGYSRSDLLGRPVEILMPESVQSTHRAHRTRYRADPVPRPMGAGTLLQGRRRDGSEFPVEISLSPVAAPCGQRIMAAVRDVTNRLKAERNSRAVRYALDNAVDGILISDSHTMQFTYVNHQAAQMHGYSIDEMLAMTPLHLTASFTADSLRETVAPLLSGEVSALTLNATDIRKDGTEFPVEIHVNRAPASVEEPQGPFVALVRDISGRIRAEQALTASQAWAQVVEDRERLARDLHDKVIGELFGIGLRLQALTSRFREPGPADHLAAAVNSLDDVIRLIRHTIFDITPQPDTNTTTRMEQQIRGFSARLGHEPELRISGPIDGLSEPIVDTVLVVLNEALTNVAKHAKATKTEVAMNHAGGRLTLTVADNGIGITDPEPHRPGGLGINNIKSRADTLNGHCTITPNPAGGTTVTLTVPLD
jgi:PAS domain S-box-containing protein